VIIDVESTCAGRDFFGREWLSESKLDALYPTNSNRTGCARGLFPTSTTFIITDPKKNFMIDSAYAGARLACTISRFHQRSEVFSRFRPYFEHPDVPFRL